MKTDNEPISITVEYFAQLRACAKKKEETHNLEQGDLSALYARLKSQYHFPLERHSVHVAVNDEFASWDTVLRSGDRVVFIPPVSGG